KGGQIVVIGNLKSLISFLKVAYNIMITILMNLVSFFFRANPLIRDGLR
ncbi:MAG: hypothetical protein QG588_1837, partial [Candidatus Poribacteria bacterium]|nr:hypothetical protein [Candidatus Poribacteria bacterium]